MLRTPLCSSHNSAAWTMNQPHARLDFIAVLPTRTTGNEEFYIAVALQRFTVGRILFGHLHPPNLIFHTRDRYHIDYLPSILPLRAKPLARPTHLATYFSIT